MTGNERALGAVVRKPRVGAMKVLEFIQDEIAAGRPFPSAVFIASRFGWKEPSARDALMRLAAGGLLSVARREPYGRGWRYVYKLPDDGASL